MFHRYVIVLLLLTLSRRGEPQTVETTTNAEWYAANAINDGNYSPKSISEIFSTENTFSTINPIIVLPSSTESPSTHSKSQIEASTTPLPYAVQDLSTKIPSSVQPKQTQTSKPPVSLQQPAIPSYSQSRPVTPSVLQPPLNPSNVPPQSVNPSYVQPQPAIASNSQPRPITPDVQSPPVIPLYVQAHTSIPSNTQIPPISHFNNQIQIQNLPPNQNLQTYQLVPIIHNTPYIQPYVPAFKSTSPQKESTIKPATKPQIPCKNSTSSPTRSYPQIRIRMVSPRGVTNITVNPTNTTNIQTSKNTKQSKRRNRNDYDECIGLCGNENKRICSAPINTRPIDPDTLRGFPSICHMACHNNFRNIKYEKLLEGRCGRLRTRIRPVDSNDKIKRNELNKSQYQVVQDPHTIIEFNPVV